MKQSTSNRNKQRLLYHQERNGGRSPKLIRCAILAVVAVVTAGLTSASEPCSEGTTGDVVLVLDAVPHGMAQEQFQNMKTFAKSLVDETYTDTTLDLQGLATFAEDGTGADVMETLFSTDVTVIKAKIDSLTLPEAEPKNEVTDSPKDAVSTTQEDETEEDNQTESRDEVTATPIYAMSTTQEDETEDFNPCRDIVPDVQDDAMRLITNVKRNASCDGMLEGWTRFQANTKEARIVYDPPPYGSCYTSMGIWVDLENEALPAYNEQRDVKLCTSIDVGLDMDSEAPCGETSIIQLLNCGTFLLYNLSGVPPPSPKKYCGVGFCVTYLTPSDDATSN